jgi:hypothetical protein
VHEVVHLLITQQDLGQRLRARGDFARLA